MPDRIEGHDPIGVSSGRPCGLIAPMAWRKLRGPAGSSQGMSASPRRWTHATYSRREGHVALENRTESQWQENGTSEP